MSDTVHREAGPAARIVRFAGALGGAALLASAPAAQLPICPQDGSFGYTVVSLTGLEGESFQAAALNDAGEVAGVILSQGPGDPAEAFVWKDGTLATRAFPNSVVTVTDVNEDGVLVGTVRQLQQSDAELFTWDSRNDVLQVVPTTFVPFPQGINDDLVVVGVDQDGLFGFAVDTVTGVEDVIAFGAVPAQGVGTPGALAISGSGVAVGAEVIFLQQQGFFQETPYRWTKTGGIEQLEEVVGGFGGRAVDVASNGNVAGYVLDEFFTRSTALWTNGGDTLMNLGSPPNFFVSDALALNVHDQVAVVAPNDLFGFTRAFVWEGGVWNDLSCYTPPGTFAGRPVDLNDVGEVLVQLTDPSGLFIVDVVVMRPDDPFVAAAELIRPGTPPNPVALLPGVTSGPVLGAVWDPVIDHTSFFPAADVDFLALSLTPLNVPLPPFGTLLCGPAILSLFQVPGVPFALFVPPDPTLSGVDLCAAGGSASVAGTVLLTNALDVTLGDF